MQVPLWSDFDSRNVTGITIQASIRRGERLFISIAAYSIFSALVSQFVVHALSHATVNTVCTHNDTTLLLCTVGAFNGHSISCDLNVLDFLARIDVLLDGIRKCII